MNTKNFTLVGLAVLVVVCSVAGFFAWPFINSSLNRASGTPTPPPRVLPPEVVQSTQRIQSTTPKRAGVERSPWGIALDQARGFVWVAQLGCEMKQPICEFRDFDGAISKYSLADGSLIANFKMPSGFSNPLFIEVGPDGHVWFTQPNTDAVGEFNPDTLEFKQVKGPAGGAPFDLVFDKNGNVWFTQMGGHSVGFIDTKAETRKVVTTPLPTPGSTPYGIGIDPKGTIWVAQNAKMGKIASFTPSTSGTIQITEHALFDPTSQPHLIISDAKGIIWYTLGFKGQLGRFNPADGSSTAIKVTNCVGDGCTHTSGIAADKDGNIWFTDSLADIVGYYSPSTNKVYPTKLVLNNPKNEKWVTNVHPHDGLVIDNYGTLWFTEEYRRNLVMAPNKQISTDLMTK